MKKRERELGNEQTNETKKNEKRKFLFQKKLLYIYIYIIIYTLI